MKSKNKLHGKKNTPIQGIEPWFARWERTVLAITLYRIPIICYFDQYNPNQLGKNIGFHFYGNQFLYFASLNIFRSCFLQS